MTVKTTCMEMAFETVPGTQTSGEPAAAGAVVTVVWPPSPGPAGLASGRTGIRMGQLLVG